MVETRASKRRKSTSEMVETRASKRRKSTSEMVETRASKKGKSTSKMVETRASKKGKPTSKMVETRASKRRKSASEMVETRASKRRKSASEMVETRASKRRKSASEMVETRASKRRKSTSKMVETRASKRRKSTSNAQLPQDIIDLILWKLPVKSLLRFRSVSKPWRALISSSEFVKEHLRTFANDKEYNHHRVVLKDKDCNLKDCSLRSLLENPIVEASDIDYPMQDFNVRWCDAANGLICLAGTYKYIFDESIKIDHEKWPSPAVNLCIGNPSIRKWKILPRFSWKPFCVLPVRYGFGYDELNDDYKVVVMFDDKRSSNELSVKIYSLKSDSWKRVLPGFQVGRNSWIDHSTKCVKGKIYWNSSISDHKYNIVSFDLANETWGMLEQPDYGRGKFDLELGGLGSDLVVLCNYKRSNHSDLWVMNGYGTEASWKKMFTIRCPDDDPVNYDYQYYAYSSRPFSPPFFQSYNGELLLTYHSNFKIYNPKDDSIRHAQVTDLKYCLEAEIYVESLVNPLAIADQEHDNNED